MGGAVLRHPCKNSEYAVTPFLRCAPLLQNRAYSHNNCRISVRRASVLADSYQQLRMRSAEELRGKLVVTFVGEDGVDAGGLTREWYT